MDFTLERKSEQVLVPQQKAHYQVKPGAELAISAANLQLGEAQRLAQQIQQFIGVEILIQGVDG